MQISCGSPGRVAPQGGSLLRKGYLYSKRQSVSVGTGFALFLCFKFSATYTYTTFLSTGPTIYPHTVLPTLLSILQTLTCYDCGALSGYYLLFLPTLLTISMLQPCQATKPPKICLRRWTHTNYRYRLYVHTMPVRGENGMKKLLFPFLFTRCRDEIVRYRHF